MYHSVRPWLFKIHPELAHAVSTRLGSALAGPVLRRKFRFGHVGLGQRAMGINFANPIGIAAGLDKNARHLPLWESLGCGFAEIGSVTANSTRGNPRPRVFRLPEDDAIINRMGLPNQGAQRVARRLKHARKRVLMPVGINLAKTPGARLHGDAAIEDYCRSFTLLAGRADYIVLNLSCPNTSDGKSFEDPEALDRLLAALGGCVRHPPPVLLKLSPPISPRVVYDSRLEELVKVADQHEVDGFVVTNTSADRQGLITPAAEIEHMGAGGLSGKPLLHRALGMVSYLYRLVGRTRTIVGVGGVASVDDAYAMICAGATLVQLYTGLVYFGPAVIYDIKVGLINCLELDGFTSISAAVGSRSRGAPVQAGW